jgi:hypothetical protein
MSFGLNYNNFYLVYLIILAFYAHVLMIYYTDHLHVLTNHLALMICHSLL